MSEIERDACRWCEDAAMALDEAAPYRAQNPSSEADGLDSAGGS